VIDVLPSASKTVALAKPRNSLVGASYKPPEKR
jgi:hypothetical protein